MASISQNMATFIKELDYTNIPAKVEKSARIALLDCLGNIIASTNSSEYKLISQCSSLYGNSPDESTAIGLGKKLPEAGAAFINGCLGRILDLDDGELFSRGHPGTVIIPAALATGERMNCSLSELISGCVCGYEIYLHLGRTINMGHRNKGFETTGTCGTFASTAAASKIAGLSKKQIANAIGIAASSAAGLSNYVSNGAHTKVLLPGLAAARGIISTKLAALNMTGAVEAFEGAKGSFFKAMCTELNLEHLDNLGSDFYLLDIYHKKHACMRRMHTVMDAVISLRSRYKINFDEISKVEVEASPFVIELNNEDPKNKIEAQGSIPYCIGVALINGEISPQSFTQLNKEALNIAKRVYFRPSVETSKDSSVKQWKSKVSIYTKDNCYVEIVDIPKGDPLNPLTSEEIKDKFHKLCSPILGNEKVQKTIKTVLDDDLSNVYVRDLMDLVQVTV